MHRDLEFVANSCCERPVKEVSDGTLFHNFVASFEITHTITGTEIKADNDRSSIEVEFQTYESVDTELESGLNDGFFTIGAFLSVAHSPPESLSSISF